MRRLVQCLFSHLTFTYKATEQFFLQSAKSEYFGHAAVTEAADVENKQQTALRFISFSILTGQLKKTQIFICILIFRGCFHSGS